MFLFYLVSDRFPDKYESGPFIILMHLANLVKTKHSYSEDLRETKIRGDLKKQTRFQGFTGKQFSSVVQANVTLMLQGILERFASKCALNLFSQTKKDIGFFNVYGLVDLIGCYWFGNKISVNFLESLNIVVLCVNYARVSHSRLPPMMDCCFQLNWGK